MAKKKLLSIETIEYLANSMNWDVLEPHPDQKEWLVTCVKDVEGIGSVKLEIWTSGKAATTLQHPKDKARGQKANKLHRDWADINELILIIRDVRVHTGKGYRKKKATNKPNNTFTLHYLLSSYGQTKLEQILKPVLLKHSQFTKAQWKSLHKAIDLIYCAHQMILLNGDLDKKILKGVIEDRVKLVERRMSKGRTEIFKDNIINHIQVIAA